MSDGSLKASGRTLPPGTPCNLADQSQGWVQSDERKRGYEMDADNGMGTSLLFCFDVCRTSFACSIHQTSPRLFCGQKYASRWVPTALRSWLTSTVSYRSQSTFTVTRTHPQARSPGSREYRLIRHMHETSPGTSTMLTLNFPDFESSDVPTSRQGRSTSRLWHTTLGHPPSWVRTVAGK